MISTLSALESEAIFIIREAFVQAEKPVILYSMGKDSSVLLHLAKKAFAPSPLPMPLLHIDTLWKFKEMYALRRKIASEEDIEMHVHVNVEGKSGAVSPFDGNGEAHTELMKTQALKQALDSHKFDVVFGGARRDEERSRAKERIFSFRNSQHYWDVKKQRPEPWQIYNGMKLPGESIRVYPLSNWTELDIWFYIAKENIEVVPLYFAAKRPVVVRGNKIVMIDDERISLLPGESVRMKKIRFRTLGCYPLTGGIESSADSLLKVIKETAESKMSERENRAIDSGNSSMEQKKQAGYF